MRISKKLGLAIMVAGLMAFTGSASATTLTSASGAAYWGEIEFQSEGSVFLDGSFVDIECEWMSMRGGVTQQGNSVTAQINFYNVQYKWCIFPIKVTKIGTFELHKQSGMPAKPTWSGAEIQAETSVGTCIFTTSGTDMGALTDTSVTAGKATLDVSSAKIPRTGGNFLCGSSGILTGSLAVTTPSTLYIDS